MKIYTKIVMDLETLEVLEEVSFEYNGELALCDGNHTDPSKPGYHSPHVGIRDEGAPVNQIPIAWGEEKGGSSSSTAGSSYSGTAWDNPIISGSLANLFPDASSFAVPGGTVPFSLSSASSFQGMDWNDPNVQRLYGAVAPGITDFNIDPGLRDYSTQQSTSGAASSGQSGMDWTDPFAGSILSTLTREAQALPGRAGSMGDTLMSGYGNLLQEALQGGAFQDTLNDLAERGMIDSTVASNALAKTTTDISKTVADKAFDAQMAQLGAQMQVPTSLAEMAALGQSSSDQARTDAQSTAYKENELAAPALQAGYNTEMLQALADLGIINTSQAMSYEEDPIAQYEVMADYYPSMVNALANLGRESAGEDSASSSSFSRKYWEDPSQFAQV